jgi:hypothetical protein
LTFRTTTITGGGTLPSLLIMDEVDSYTYFVDDLLIDCDDAVFIIHYILYILYKIYNYNNINIYRSSF